METKDFEGIYKYKFIMPGLYILTFASMFLGPFYFPKLSQTIFFVILAYVSIRILMFGLTSFYVLYENMRILNRVKKTRNLTYQPPESKDEEILHAIILPNYNEDVSVIEDTLKILAQHKRSKYTYFIFLAMQKREKGADKKAEMIMDKFKDKFRYMDYTLHEAREGEFKGKGSNISWCAEHMQQKFKKIGVSTENLFLTIIDADSWGPDVYFDEVQDHIRNNYDKRYTFIYQPIQCFTRNQMEVPVVNRVFDLMASTTNSAYAFSFIGYGFAVSNYTFSFNLIKRIGYWDKSQYAIAEDYHFTQKAYWKTCGQAKAIPIHVPFNQLCLSTGQGYWNDIKARFWQSERHARMIDDIPYIVNMMRKENLCPETFWMCLVTFETYFLATIVPLVGPALMLQGMLLSPAAKASLGMVSDPTIGMFFTIMNLGTILMYLTFQVVKRRSTTILYNLRNESLLRILQVVLMYFPIYYLIFLPTCIIAAFAGLRLNREWHLSMKASSKKHQ